MSDTDDPLLPPEVALAILREIREIQAWAQRACNIRFQPAANGTIGYTIHDSAGVEVAHGSNYEAFATAFAKSIEAMLDLHHTQSDRELADLDAALARGGLTVFGERPDGASEGVAVTWGFRWVCGCHGEGFPSKMAALHAAISMHARTHRESTPQSLRRSVLAA